MPLFRRILGEMKAFSHGLRKCLPFKTIVLVALAGVLASCGDMLPEGERTRRDLRGRESEILEFASQVHEISKATQAAIEVGDQLSAVASSIDTEGGTTGASSSSAAANRVRETAQRESFSSAPRRAAVNPASGQSCKPPLPGSPKAGDYECSETCYISSYLKSNDCQKATRRISVTETSGGKFNVSQSTKMDSGWTESSSYTATGVRSCTQTPLSLSAKTCPSVVDTLYTYLGEAYSAVSVSTVSLTQITNLLPLYVPETTLLDVVSQFSGLIGSHWINGAVCYSPTTKKILNPCPTLPRPSCSCSIESSSSAKCSFCAPVLTLDVVTAKCDPSLQSCVSGQILCTGASDPAFPDRCRLVQSGGKVILNVPRCTANTTTHASCATASTGIQCVDESCSRTGWESDSFSGVDRVLNLQGETVLEFGETKISVGQGLDPGAHSGREDVLRAAQGKSSPLRAAPDCTVQMNPVLADVAFVRNELRPLPLSPIPQGFVGLFESVKTIKGWLFSEACRTSSSTTAAISLFATTVFEKGAEGVLWIANEALPTATSGNCSGQPSLGSEVLRGSWFLPNQRVVTLSGSQCTYRPETAQLARYLVSTTITTFPVGSSDAPFKPKAITVQRTETSIANDTPPGLVSPSALPCTLIEATEATTTVTVGGTRAAQTVTTKTNPATCKPEVSVENANLPISITCEQEEPASSSSGSTGGLCGSGGIPKVESSIDLSGSKVPVVLGLEDGNLTTSIALANNVQGVLRFHGPDEEGFTASGTVTLNNALTGQPMSLDLKYALGGFARATGSVVSRGGNNISITLEGARGSAQSTFKATDAGEAEQFTGSITFSKDSKASSGDKLAGSGTISIPKADQTIKVSLSVFESGCATLKTNSGQVISSTCNE